MSNGKYLLFSKKIYASRKDFEFPSYGVTIYCAETDKIYRPQLLTELKGSGDEEEYFDPELFIKQEKLIYFCYGGEHQVNPFNEEFLRGKKNKYDNVLTEEEFQRGIAAIERYKADRLGSLTWPLKEPPRPSNIWNSHFSVTPIDQGHRDLLILGKDFKNTGPEKLPGRPKAVNFVGGKLVELSDAQIKAGVQARL